MGVQKHYKKRFTKKSGRKVPLQNNRQKSQTDFFPLIVLMAFLGVSR
jgi:hypothetical protein